MKSFPSVLFRLSRMITFVTVLSAGLASAHAQTFKVLHEWQGPDEGTEASSLIVGTDGRLYGTTYDGGPDRGGTIFAINRDGSEFTVLHFLSGSDGGSPCGGLIEGSDGRLYGTTYVGGTYGYGTLFAVNPDGSEFKVLHHLNLSSDGGNPCASLVQGADDRVYGTTSWGGTYGDGTLFAIHPDGSGFTVLHNLASSDGGGLYAGLTEGADGRMYGSTVGGGTYGYGTLFGINPDGSGFTVLRHLNGSTDGSDPIGGLTEGSDGRLYGTTMQRGIYWSGTLFALNLDGSDFTVLYNFGSADPWGRPWASLIEGADGRLYGTTSGGTIFAFNPGDSVFTVLKTTYHGSPYTALTEDANGRLYGTTSTRDYAGGTPPPGTLFAINPDGSDFTVLRELNRAFDGAHPRASLTEGTNGRLYGTTYDGGTYNQGTLFALNPDGSGFIILRHLDYASDGALPTAGLIEGADGRLYGTAYHGGTYDDGTLFALNSDGSGFTVLRHLNRATDIAFPNAALIQGTDGRLYGTTIGSIFALNPDGTGFTVLRHLISSTDGRELYASLTEGADGRLYGTAQGGGANGYGTLFAINPNGSGFTVLLHFNGFADGRYPYAGLTEGADGRMYGTTMMGGTYDDGILFALNPDGSGFTVLQHLMASDGAYPRAGLTEGIDGRLYGTTSLRGNFNGGALFALNPDGSGFTVLRHFNYSNDGASPYASLIRSVDGRLYGTTSLGGSDDLGTIFVLSFVPEITSALTATGQFKQPFSYTITATNDPDDFDALEMPTGLTVNHETGLISGVPREKGEFAVTIAASNSYGTCVADLSLTIAVGPPAITRQPQDVTAMASKNASFSVTAKSTTKLGYQWLKDDEPIPGATGHKLMLHKITSDDAGSYRVVVSNSGGSVESDSATLTVLPPHAPKSGVATKTGVGARR